jgi:hypothetical protein
MLPFLIYSEGDYIGSESLAFRLKLYFIDDILLVCLRLGLFGTKRLMSWSFNNLVWLFPNLIGFYSGKCWLYLDFLSFSRLLETELLNASYLLNRSRLCLLTTFGSDRPSKIVLNLGFCYIFSAFSVRATLGCTRVSIEEYCLSISGGDIG